MASKIKKILALLLALGIGGVSFYYWHLTNFQQQFVNIYDWYGVLPKSVLIDFEKETGIHVRYDVYDSNEILEAKLLASNCGYDVVFPTASPFVAWQIQAGLYEPLDKTKLPPLQEILDPIIVGHMSDIDPGIGYAIPLYWGTIGYVYDAKILQKVLPQEQRYTNSWKLLLDPKILEKFKDYGVSFLEEACDVLPTILLYFNVNPRSRLEQDLHFAADHFSKLRPFIKRFSSCRVVNDLVMGEVAIAEAWSGEAVQAIEEAKELGRDLHYVIPDEGTLLWVDTVAIPKGGPNLENAYKFINYILRPQIIARISAFTKMANSVLKSKDFLPKEIKDNPSIYPKKKLFLNYAPRTKEDLAFEQLQTRLWAQLRLNQHLLKD